MAKKGFYYSVRTTDEDLHKWILQSAQDESRSVNSFVLNILKTNKLISEGLTKQLKTKKDER